MLDKTNCTDLDAEQRDSAQVAALAASQVHPESALPSRPDYATPAAPMCQVGLSQFADDDRASTCTCPSGDGSLRWLCPMHPPEPVAWMDPNEACVMDAFLWQKDAANPRYKVPVFAAPVAAVSPSESEGFSAALGAWLSARDYWQSDEHENVKQAWAALLKFTVSPSDAKNAEWKPLAHGHREDWYLLANARRLAEKPIHAIRTMPNWVLASELFATGCTAAHQICRDAGIDPDGYRVQRAAMAASRNGGAK